MLFIGEDGFNGASSRERCRERNGKSCDDA